MRHTIRLFLLAVSMLALSGLAKAQGVPDCQFSGSATAAGSSTAISTRPTTSGGSAPCLAWRLTYWTNAASATSIQIEGAADSGNAPTGSYTLLTVAAGGGSGGGSTSNPATTATAGQINLCCDYWPWVRVTVNTLTSSGAGTIIQWRVYGYKGTSAAMGTGGGGGGGGSPTGPAGGDLGGNYPNPTVIHLTHVTDGSLANSGLANPSTTVNGQTCTLGSTCTVTGAPSGSAGGDLSGSYPNPNVANLSHVTNGSLANSGLANASTTVNGQTCTLGSTCTISGGGTGNAASQVTYTVGASATLTCPSSSAGTVTIFNPSGALAANEALSFASCTAGQIVVVRVLQAAAGGPYTVSGLPTGSPQVSPVASVTTSYILHATGATTVAYDNVSADSGPGVLTESAAPGTPPSGLGFLWADSTNHVLEYKNPSGVVSNTSVPQTCSANQAFTAMSAGGAYTCSAVGSGTIPSTTDLLIGDGAGNAADSHLVGTSGGITSDTTTTALVYQGGKDASANSALGGVTLRGASETGSGGASSQGGPVLISGGSNAATNAASVGGTVMIKGGNSSGASNTGLPGLLISTDAYLQSGTVTQWNLQCVSAAMAVSDCAASPTSIVGVAFHLNSTVSVQVAVNESETPVNASAAVTVGHTVCAGTTAGQVTDSGGTAPCTTGRTIGLVLAISGTWPTFPDGTAFPTLSSTLPLIKLGRYLTSSTINGTVCTPGSTCTPIPAGNCTPTTYTTTYTDAAFIVASTTATQTLVTLSSGTRLCGAVFRNQTNFAGTSITAMTCSLGTPTSGNSTIYLPALSVFQTAQTLGQGGNFLASDLSTPDSSLAVLLTCTATGANFGNGSTTVLTAGKLWTTVYTTALPAGI